MENEMDKNDHRVIGKELGLFVFSDTVGKGLPLYTEKGATIRRELERFVVDLEIKRGYKHVTTPDIAKIDLYKKSGHYPYYKDTMYSPIVVDDEEFMLRPMTCPHHFELYLSKPHSYRELPMRIAEIAKLYRYEASGNLSGLVRVRSFCLADSHIICADDEQAKEEVKNVLDLIEEVAGTFGLKKGDDFWYRLSLGDRADDKKYYKDDAAWEKSEGILREVLQGQGVKFNEAKDEAAFYGPKIDIQMKDVRGIENTAFTVQYDFVMPKRFNLVYTAKDGSEQQAVVVHRSSIGAIERVMAFIIEHYKGSFPLWLSPTQVKVIPVRENHSEYAGKVHQMLVEAGIRSEIDLADENLGSKVRDAKTNKIPYWIVIGDKEVEAGKVTLESRDAGQLGQMTTEELLSKLKGEIANKK
jgi:threonyl-tRNA synthetase